MTSVDLKTHYAINAPRVDSGGIIIGERFYHNLFLLYVIESFGASKHTHHNLSVLKCIPVLLVVCGMCLCLLLV